jgi:hypothetical protein
MANKKTEVFAMRQYKVSLFAHYVRIPATSALSLFCKSFKNLVMEITGHWWCAGCKEWHHGRVYAFSLDDFASDGVCGLHVEKEHYERYRFIRGSGVVTDEEEARLQAAVMRDFAGDGGSDHA